MSASIADSIGHRRPDRPTGRSRTLYLWTGDAIGPKWAIKDAYKKFLDAQWEDAVIFARENGYENVELTRVPSAGHDAFPDRVVQFFASLLPKKGD